MWYICGTGTKGGVVYMLYVRGIVIYMWYICGTGTKGGVVHMWYVCGIVTNNHTSAYISPHLLFVCAFFK